MPNFFHTYLFSGAPSCKYLCLISLCCYLTTKLIPSLLARCEHHCTSQQPLQRGGAVPDPVWVGSKWLLPSRGSQVPQALPFIFLLCCPLNDRSRAAHSFFKISRLFSLSFFLPYSCSSSSLHSSPLDER